MTRMPFWSALVLVGCTLAGCGGGPTAAELIQQGDQLTAEGKDAEAILRFRAAVQEDERNGSARQKLGRALIKTGDATRGAQELVRAADLLPSDHVAQLDAVKGLIATRRFEDARTRAEKVLSADPKNVLAHVLRATATAGLDDAESALTSMEEALALDPNRSSSYVAIASIQASEGKLAEAEGGFKQAITVAPNSMDARIALASFYWSTQRPKEAERALTEALGLEPGHAQTNLALANLYSRTGRLTEAEAPLKRASEREPANLQLRLMLADHYVAVKKYPEARAVLQELSKRKESAAAAGGRLAGVEYESGNREGAHRLLETVIKEQPANSDLRTLKGNWLLREGKPAEALEEAQAVIKARPQSPDAHFLLGSAYLKLGNTADAERAFQETLRLRPRAANAQVELANISLARGRVSEALTLAQQAVASSPTHPGARVVHTMAMMASGDVSGAETNLRPFVKSGSSDVWMLWGRIQQRQGRLSEATQAYRHALELDPGSVDALIPLINLDLAAGRRADAVKTVEAQVKLAPNNWRLHLTAGRTYARAGDLVKAEAALRRAIEADPAQMEPYHVLGQLFVRQKRLDEAIKAYETQLAERPDNVGAQTMVGMLQLVQGKRSEARARFEKALGLDPRAPVASNNLAYLDAEAGTNLDIALNRAQTAKAALPDDPDVDDTLGWVYVKRGLPALAVTPIRQAVQTNPSNPLYRYHLGVAYAKGGDEENARIELKEALRLSSSFEGAAEANRLLQTLGN